VIVEDDEPPIAFKADGKTIDIASNIVLFNIFFLNNLKRIQINYTLFNIFEF